MKISIWIFAILSCVAIVTGCHHRPHHRRRKRSSVGDLTVNTFFPTCIQSERNASGDLASTINTWNGPVSLVVFHSAWYERVNQTCGGDEDTAQCWEDAATEILLPESPTLPAVQVCIGLYNDTYGAPGRRKKRDTERTNFMNNPSCPNISRQTYVTRLQPDLMNDTLPDNVRQAVQSNLTDGEDVAFTFQHINDALKFVEGDLYCPTCSCDDLADAKKYFGNFEFRGTKCSSCWFTRFATSLRDDSPYKDIVSQITFEEANFTISNPCPENYDINFSDDVAVKEVLDMTVSCKKNKVQIELRSFGLAAHGYRRVDEVFVTRQSASIANNDTISDSCVADFKPETNKEITTIKFPLEACNHDMMRNATHEIYKFAVKNKLPPRDLYENGNQSPRISICGKMGFQTRPPKNTSASSCVVDGY